MATEPSWTIFLEHLKEAGMAKTEPSWTIFLDHFWTFKLLFLWSNRTRTNALTSRPERLELLLDSSVHPEMVGGPDGIFERKVPVGSVPSRALQRPFSGAKAPGGWANRGCSLPLRPDQRDAQLSRQSVAGRAPNSHILHRHRFPRRREGGESATLMFRWQSKEVNSGEGGGEHRHLKIGTCDRYVCEILLK